jgi:hypothetical protein
MTWNDKVRIAVGAITLDLPAVLIRAHGRSVDSASGVFGANGLVVNVDNGPFADRLDSYAGSDEYSDRIATFAGATGRLVSCRARDGRTHITAFHARTPRVFTVVTHADGAVPPSVVEDIFHSLRLSSDRLDEEHDVDP